MYTRVFLLSSGTRDREILNVGSICLTIRKRETSSKGQFSFFTNEFQLTEIKFWNFLVMNKRAYSKQRINEH